MVHPALAGHEPLVALELFSEILQIPRPSHQESAMIDWVTRWAQKNGFAVTTDKFNNVVVRVPATHGYEHVPSVTIQGHLDMVYNPTDEKVVQTPINIELVGEYIQTVGQSRTLGADNAAALILAMDAAVTAPIHGEMFLLFTAAEEDDLSGAENFSPDNHNMSGCNLLINLDTPQRLAVTTMSAGFQYVHATQVLQRESQAAGPCFKLTLTGMAGGHSGDNVGEGRGNSNQLMAELLSLLPQGSKLVLIKGGEAKNGLPSTAECVVQIPAPEQTWAGKLQNLIAEARVTYKRPEIQLIVTTWTSDTAALTSEAHTNLVKLLLTLPNGVIKWSSSPGVPELSTTVAVLEQDGDALKIHQIVRGAEEAAMQELARTVAGVYNAHGFTTGFGHHAFGWKQDASNPLVAATFQAFEAQGQPAKEQKVHCGLEMAALGRYFPTMVSFGAEVLDEHATSERMSLPTLVLARGVLHTILKDIAEGRVQA